MSLAIRSPAARLRDARTGHGRALSLAAWFRECHARGEPDALARHAWALEQARFLRGRYGDLSRPRAPPG